MTSSTATPPETIGERGTKARPMRLDTAMLCRMPKKIHSLGNTKKVARLIAAAAPATTRKRLQKEDQRVWG
jgi:hypothetical protein